MAQVKWFGAVLEGNADRAKLQFEPQAVAPHGFLLNVTAGAGRGAGRGCDTLWPS